VYIYTRLLRERFWGVLRETCLPGQPLPLYCILPCHHDSLFKRDASVMRYSMYMTRETITSVSSLGTLSARRYLSQIGINVGHVASHPVPLPTHMVLR
jgi:hypothetical protein